MNHKGLVAVASLIIAMCCWPTCKGDKTVYLQRGNKGVIPIHTDQQNQDLTELDSVYWYFGSHDSDGLIISKISQRVRTKHGIPQDRYGIDREFSLVIKNVSWSNHGMYYYRVQFSPVNHFTGNVRAVVKDDVLFLERGEDGKLPYFPTVYNQYYLLPSEYIFWYYGDQEEHLVSCTVANGSIQASVRQKGIYDVDDNCSLVILNVTDSNEGAYRYELWLRRLQVPDGHIRLVVKDTTRDYSTGAPKAREREEREISPWLILLFVFIGAYILIRVILRLYRRFCRPRVQAVGEKLRALFQR